MPFHAMCPGCTTSAYLDCTCPPSFDPAAAGMHLDGVCALASPDGAVTCAEASDDPRCCHDDHDHAAQANGCPVAAANGGDGHRDCPEPATCPLHASVKAHYAATVAYAAEANGGGAAMLAVVGPEPPDDCPGGHCHWDLDDCTVCRPLILTAMPGSARLQPVTGG
jgi:hypothetical protein